MGTVVMMAEDELFHQVLAVGKILGAEEVPAEALFTHSAVEALDEGLLILPVGPGYAM